MKKIINAVVAAMLAAMPVMVQGKTLEVSFDYQRQSGPGSNQYAVWIENEKGEVVKTLFVTSFTTKGRARGHEEPMRGYQKRPNCVPLWVKTVKANNLTDEQIDAFTGATPQADGRQTYTWDFTDQKGKTVKKGSYKIVVEATLYQGSIVTYSGSFQAKDKAGSITLTSAITEPDEAHKNMITNVKAEIR